jgi:hypothetical protein
VNFLVYTKPSFCMSFKTTYGTLKIRVHVFIGNFLFRNSTWEKSQNRVVLRGLITIVHIVYVIHKIGPPSSTNYVGEVKFTLQQ